MIYKFINKYNRDFQLTIVTLLLAARIMQTYATFSKLTVLRCPSEKTPSVLRTIYSTLLPPEGTSAATRLSLSQKRGFRPYAASVEGFQDMMLLKKP